MPVSETKTRMNPAAATRLVRVEVEVPEDAVESLLAYARELRSTAGAKPQSFKELLELAPGDDAFWDDVATARDKRPARDIHL